ncbi:MAG TPA: bifunctional proline dehydrogenase/L-glutamate gamma-semialdehyde dehydrogenase PutA [Devosiaceae bacterium]
MFDPLTDEGACVAKLVRIAALSEADRVAIGKRAVSLVEAVRDATPGILESFLSEYGLSTREGVALMCLAEALLRVPDAETMDDLIRDKIAPHDWGAHLGKAGSALVNASTWALMLTGQTLGEADEAGMAGALHGMVQRLGEPVVRTAVSRAMKEMGAQFVLGRDIAEAMRRGADRVRKGYTYSYDMLGEAAWTAADAARYLDAYHKAIAAISASARHDDIRRNPGISVKLSALHPRYFEAQRERAVPELAERLAGLCHAAKAGGIGLNIDAEEAERLSLSLEIIEIVLSDPGLAGWDGFGVVVQAYGKRAPQAIDWLYDLAQRHDRRIMVRLVKGAYWDTEIKRAQVLGLDGYPVFTRKVHTDVSYIANARKLLGMTDRIYPQFATHNAHTVAAIMQMGPERDAFEFQRLHGMGVALHEILREKEGFASRIYAPVGAHRDLLAYLVRRLLENGANSSFVNQIVDKRVPAQAIARDPFEAVAETGGQPEPRIRQPSALFAPRRRNSEGIDLTDPAVLRSLEETRAPFRTKRWSAAPISCVSLPTVDAVEVRNPANLDDVVGTVAAARPEAAGPAFAAACDAAPAWAGLPAEARAGVLERAADLYEAHRTELMALACREAGKTLIDALGEVREATDFLRYYASEIGNLSKDARPRGVFVCISPWNFPLAIFTGQIAAALAAGNAVIAKPAEQTPLIAARAVQLLLEAGVPDGVLQLLPGDGPGVGAALVASPGLAGVCFTGSTEVAGLLNRQLAKSSPNATLIAETGGINAMIVDSTALPEQAVRDILASAFQSAGQRCSALRVLYVQREVEKRILEMLFGAMDELQLGDPWEISTDVGPLIDEEAQAGIGQYCAEMTDKGRLLKKLDAPAGGRMIGPHVFRVSGIGEIEREVFGPVLHVASFEADELEDVVRAINAKGYGLTFAIHSRVDARVQTAVDLVEAGNVYVNRNQIGAVVGSQPFGGEGLSGTGPKAGGPGYLPRFTLPAGTRPAAVQQDGVRMVDANEFAEAALKAETASRANGIALQSEDGTVSLPGPTGESNRLRVVPRGLVACLGPSREALLDQVSLAVAAGNSVVAVAPGAPRHLKALTWPHMALAAIDGRLTPDVLATSEIAAVAFCGSEADAAELRQVLADRKGPIVPFITTCGDETAYVLERAVCIDTTAAGGNVDLLGQTGA